MICPDCSATAPERVDLQHDPACPLGMAIEALAETDRAWFLAHPGEDIYHRPIDPAEVREWTEMLGEPDIATCNRMTVWAVEPGVRALQPLFDPETALVPEVDWRVLDLLFRALPEEGE